MPSQLSQLISLIANATKLVEDTFAEAAGPNVPSLDDTTPHPLDGQVLSLEMREAIQTIEGACAQLCALVARSNRTMLNRALSNFEPACICVVVNFQIADHLIDKPDGIHVSELGALSGAEPGKLGRIMRLLASKHCFREVNCNVFANNRLSMMLLSTNGFSPLADHFTNISNKALSMLTETLQDPHWGHSSLPLHAPFNYWSKYPGTIYSWYQSVEAEKGVHLGLAMKGWGDSIEMWAIVNVFPWGSLHDGAIVCDVGEGIGVVSLQLADAHPNLHIILQDVPAQIKTAKNEIWPKSCPAAVKDGRVEFKAIDFFVESPVKGCDVYFLKNILHNWPDNECKTILKGVGDAMLTNSRLLIFDYIIQHTNRDKDIPQWSGLKLAPEPLLPNYGAGGMIQYNIDLNMMCITNSQEHSLDHFVELGKEAGLRFVRVWDMREASIIEFCLE
ncbi:S-adenosyl-L-methionine-dependent methyltransferase [Armillaria luteobubalina]|uniref:S-adenosyl-L-methionine-dependent methyltransferase n=1 Tax=Armillaria luteobubalina TaxID=153913 RepID=A0AA39QH19_9AGAR|nr:S-adenosyl-L-methionine-dependent methyltransferase [Armillaria luteobubalina]